MSLEKTTATSQAEAAPAANTSDVKTNTAANVSAAEAVARFAKATEQPPADLNPAETEASPEPIETSELLSSETPAGESAPADSPEAAPETEVEVPAQTTEDGDHDPDGETDVLSPNSPLDAKLREKIQKRINKERAKRGELEREVAQLKEQMSALKTQPAEATPKTEDSAPPSAPSPVPSVPLAGFDDIGKLRALEQEAVAAVDTIQDILDSTRAWREYAVPSPDNPEETVNVSAAKIGNKLYTREELVDIRRKAVTTMRDVPQRISFINAREAASKQARTVFPFLADKNAPEYQMAQAAKRELPWLNNLPNAEWIIGVQIEGLKAIEARKTAAAKAAEKPKPVVRPPTKPAGDQTAVSTGGTVERLSPDSKQRQAVSAELETLRKKGGVSGDEVAAFLARKSLNSR